MPQEGSGRFEYINQTLYVGQWKLLNSRKVKHGQGKITYPGAQNGQTSYGSEEYEGMWENDKMHG